MLVSPYLYRRDHHLKNTKDWCGSNGSTTQKGYILHKMFSFYVDVLYIHMWSSDDKMYGGFFFHCKSYLFENDMH